MNIQEGGSIKQIPLWVNAMISFGYEWQKIKCNKRRIALISLPCESEAGGLVALGALRYDLERPDANVLENHFQMIKNKYKECEGRKGNENKLNWDLKTIQSNKTWKFVEYNAVNDEFLVVDSKYKENTKINNKMGKKNNGPVKQYVFKGNAEFFQINGYPIPRELKNEKLVLKEIYKDLPNCTGDIVDLNMNSSYLNLLYVTYSESVDSNYFKKYDEMFFVKGDLKYSISELLFLKNSNIKRINILNGFNEEKWNIYKNAELIILDNASMLQIVDEFFPDTDIIFLCNRSGSKESIEKIRAWVAGKQRYYKDYDYYLNVNFPSKILSRILVRK